MMDKFQLINSIIAQVDALVDMRGAEKCRVILDIMGKLAVLRKEFENEQESRKGRG